LTAYLMVGLIATFGVASIAGLGTSLAPTFKERDLVIAVQAAPGTSQPAMNRVLGLAAAELRELPGVRRVGSHVGRAIMSDQVVNIDAGQIWLSMDPHADYEATLAGVRTVLGGFPGLDLSLDTYLSGRTADVATEPADPVAIRLYGPQLDALTGQAEAVRAAIADIPGIVSPRVLAAPTEPTVEVEVDLAAAADHGLKPGDVRRAAATLVSGLEVGNLFEEQKVFEVMVIGTPAMRHNVTYLGELLIDAPDGGQVALKELAEVRITPAPVAIQREGISRFVDVVAGVEGRDVSAVQGDVQAALGSIAFPMEYHPELSTAWADQAAATQRLIGVIIAAAVIAFLVLQAAFESWRLAAVSMIGLPVAVAGGLVAVGLTGGVVTLGSLIGLLGVLAIATRNELALVDRFRQLERGGIPPGPSLVQRGTRERVGPVIATALATVLASVAIVVLGDRPGLELLHPMAIALIGGLVTSTVMNLLVVPSIYLDLTTRPLARPAGLGVPGGEPHVAGVQ
jgi:Cu/Ag efflux pump CusA